MPRIINQEEPLCLVTEQKCERSENQSPDTTTVVQHRLCRHFYNSSQETKSKGLPTSTEMQEDREPNLWSPSLSKALRERYGGSRKRTPRTLTRLMQQHRENERHRHHGLNASIREISCCIPGYDEANKETKIVKLQHIISYICHLEEKIKGLADDLGFCLDYKSLFLSPYISNTADSWKTVSKTGVSTLLLDQCVPEKPNILKRRRPLSSPTVDSTSDHIVPQVPTCLHLNQVTAPPSSTPGGPTAQTKRRRTPSNLKTSAASTSSSATSSQKEAPAWRLEEDECEELTQEEKKHKASSSQGEDLSWLEELLTSPATTMGDLCQVFEVPDLGDLPVPDPMEGELLVGMHADCTADFTDVTKFHAYARVDENPAVQNTLTPSLQASGAGGGCVARPPTPPSRYHPAAGPWSAGPPPYLPPCSDCHPPAGPSSTCQHQGEAPRHAGGGGCGCFSPQGAPVCSQPPEKSAKSKGLNQRKAVRRYDKNHRIDHRKTSWMNGFMMYSRLHRRKYIEDNPGIHTSHISKLMGQDWRSLSPEQQQPYREKAKHYIEFHILPRLPNSFRTRTK